jgi:regulator of protease activity HflC (stomatin/prohibitin superfamily)
MADGVPLVEHNDGPRHEVMVDEKREKSLFMHTVMTPCLTALCCPIACCMSCKQLDVGYEFVLLRWGQYVGTEKDAGCHCINWLTDVRLVSKKLTQYNLPTAKMVDKNGNPLLVSGVFVYAVENAQRAVLNVENYELFVRELAATTLKQVVSRFPYESPVVDEAKGGRHDVSLKTEAKEISKELVTVLQEKVNRAGVRVHSFEFNELSYAPEIAAQMLKRQQAVALVEARQKIVEGAVDIAVDAIDRLARKGVTVTDKTREHLVLNMLTVMVSDREAQPTISVAAASQQY